MNILLLSLLLTCCIAFDASAESFPYTLRWKRLVGDALQSAVALRDSVVFIGGADGRLLALSREEGTRLWQRRGNGPIRRAPAVGAEELICADAWGRVLALERRAGTLRWEAQRLGWGDAEIAVRDSLVYVSGADGWLYALHRSDGGQAWRVRSGARAVARPCLDGRDLYAVTRDGQLLAVDAASGAHRHRAFMGSRATAGPLVAGGLLVVAGDDGYARAYRRPNLDLQWERRLGARIQEPFLATGGQLVCAADNGWAYGLRLDDGQFVWKRNLGGAPQGGVARGPRGEAVVGTEDGRLVGLEVETGTTCWEVQLLNGAGARPYGDSQGLYVNAGDGYLYAFAIPSSLVSHDGVLWEDWWEVFHLGRKTGYRHRVAQQVRFRGKEALRLAAEEVAWSSGFRRGIGQVWVDESFAPLAFAQRTIEGSQVVESEGIWAGDSLRVEQRLAGHAVVRTVAVGRDVVLPEVVFARLQAEGRITSGRRDSLRVFDYASLQSRWLHVDFGTVEETPEGEALRARLRYADLWPEEMEIESWVDAQGREVQERLPLLATGQVRVDEARARSWVPPGSERALRLDHPIADPAGVEELVLGLPAGGGTLWNLIPEDGRQRLMVEADGGARLIVRRGGYDGRGSLMLPIDAPEVEPYLRSSLYIQAEDERIRALARRLRGDETNAWEVAMRLRQWVYDHMIPRDTNVRFKSTLEVLEDMEGTCSEYAVLFMALCRAAGVPARACVGFLVAQTGELVLHIWTQVYVGTWIDVDPSWEGGTVSAVHIKTGQGRLSGAEMRRMNLPLQLFLVRADTLKLREYRAAGAHFLAAAEELFAQARVAERAFEDERAQELYHQIALLPWNQRSGQAHVGIARYRLQQGEPDETVWACERILRLDPTGEEADDALFFLSRAAEANGDWEAAVAHLERLVADFPDHDLADDALGRLGEFHEKAQGCQTAVPYYERLQEEYGRSGWAAVAESALERCGETGR